MASSMLLVCSRRRMTSSSSSIAASLGAAAQAAEPANVMAATAMHAVMVRFHMVVFLCFRQE